MAAVTVGEAVRKKRSGEYICRKRRLPLCTDHQAHDPELADRGLEWEFGVGRGLTGVNATAGSFKSLGELTLCLS